MDFERSDILKPILDHLEADDQARFLGIQQGILRQWAVRGTVLGTGQAIQVASAFQSELTKRGEDIVSAIDRVLKGAYVEDFDHLAESLKAELIKGLVSAANVATSEFVRSTEQTRLHANHPNLPAKTALLDHAEKLKAKFSAEIDLVCENLRATQTPRIFFKKGEVFVGNRAARAIFESAKKSLDVIDTYFGAKVFDMLEVSEDSVQIRLISDKCDSSTLQAYQDFKKQYGRVDFRRCGPKDIHDRYIVVDSVRALHLGHSVKDLGGSASEINSVPAAEIVKHFDELWLKTTPVT
jgi:hypothetical protein